MSTTLNFKDIVDLPDWKPLAPTISTDVNGGTLISDLRNSNARNPLIYQIVSNTTLSAYNTKNDGWSSLLSPALVGTFLAGAYGIYASSLGPQGLLTTGNTTTKVVISTALPAAVGVNQLSEGTDGGGFRIRIIGSSSGGSGKIEERMIVANTSGTTPTITLDSALSFTPASGDSYEILSGRVYLITASVSSAAGVWKYYDVATNSMSSNLGITNLSSAITIETSIVSLDEQLVPSNKNPGDGFLGNVVATGSSSTTITGSAAGNDAAVLVNEYRNFQIRIVQDTATPTAVGQRRKITSHTVGASPVYTVPSWTVTPSTSATFVIENSNEILLWTNFSSVTYTYAPFAIGAMSADTWSTSTYGNRPASFGAGGMSFQAFGLNIPLSTDPDKNARHSHVFSFRGNSASTLHLLDIAGAAAGVWTTETYNANNTVPATGTSIVYDPVANNGRKAYFNINGTSRFHRFDCLTRNLSEWTFLRFTQGTAANGAKLAFGLFIDPDDGSKVSFIYTIRHSGNELFNCLIQR